MSVPSTSPNNEPRPAKLPKRWCPDCRQFYFNQGWHAENCEGPSASSRCNRPVLVFGGSQRAHCFLPSGHSGPCR